MADFFMTPLPAPDVTPIELPLSGFKEGALVRGLVNALHRTRLWTHASCSSRNGDFILTTKQNLEASLFADCRSPFHPTMTHTFLGRRESPECHQAGPDCISPLFRWRLYSAFLNIVFCVLSAAFLILAQVRFQEDVDDAENSLTLESARLSVNAGTFQLPSYLTLVAAIVLGLLAIVHSALMIWNVWDLDPLPIIGLYLGFWLWLTGSLIAQTVRLATGSMSITTTASVGDVVIQRIWRDGLEYRNVHYFHVATIVPWFTWLFTLISLILFLHAEAIENKTSVWSVPGLTLRPFLADEGNEPMVPTKDVEKEPTHGDVFAGAQPGLAAPSQVGDGGTVSGGHEDVSGGEVGTSPVQVAPVQERSDVPPTTAPGVA